jgi:hypothetical protein
MSGMADVPSKTEPSPWLSLENVFQRWRARLGSGQEAVNELEALLRSSETRLATRRVSVSGEEIFGTRGLVDTGSRPILSVVPDSDGVGDRLGIDYADYVDAHSLPHDRTEFFVRIIDDVER